MKNSSSSNLRFSHKTNLQLIIFTETQQKSKGQQQQEQHFSHFVHMFMKKIVIIHIDKNICSSCTE